MSEVQEGGGRRPLAVVSACLLGRACRYDGKHKLVPGLAERLGTAGYDVLSVCPETDSGLGCPRPPMDLHPVPPPDGELHALRADGTDCTPVLSAWVENLLAKLRQRPPVLCVLKSKSPSCGISGARPGLFASALGKAFPDACFQEEAAAQLGDDGALISNPSARAVRSGP